MTQFRGNYPTVSLLVFLECLQKVPMEVSKIKEILCKDESSKARFVEDMRRQKIHQFLIENNQ